MSAGQTQASPRYLITGASGFIGGALFNYLKMLGLAPTGVVHKASGNSEFLVADPVGPAMDWRSILRGHDVVIHAAGRAHVVAGTNTEILSEFHRTNVEGTVTLARQAAEEGVRRVVFLSSVGVNGAETFGRPFSEADTPRPEAAYAVSKLKAEQALRDILADAQMEHVIVRPPLVYGAGAPGNFARLCRLVCSGIPIPLGAVRNRRSLVSLENLVDFLTLCGVHPMAAGETFLVSDGDDISTPQFIQLIAEGAERPVRLWPVPPPFLRAAAKMVGKDAIYRQLCGSLQMDISKARDLLGWRPVLSPYVAIPKAARVRQ